MPVKQVMVAVYEGTRERLRTLARKLEAYAERTGSHPVGVSSEVINPAGCGVSMDALVNYLLDQLEAHQLRAQQQRERRKAKKA